MNGKIYAFLRWLDAYWIRYFERGRFIPIAEDGKLVGFKGDESLTSDQVGRLSSLHKVKFLVNSDAYEAIVSNPELFKKSMIQVLAFNSFRKAWDLKTDED